MTAKPDKTEHPPLLPCDFCPNGKGVLKQTQQHVYPGGIATDCLLWAIECDDCGARGPEENTPDGAAKRWNTRSRAPVAATPRKLTQPELNHLMALLEAERESGEYAGPREQYYARTERLIEWCRGQTRGNDDNKR